MCEALLLVALVCTFGGWVWGWVELGRAWRVQTTVSVPGKDSMLKSTNAPVLPILPTPEDGHFVPRKLDVFPKVKTLEIRRGRRSQRR